MAKGLVLAALFVVLCASIGPADGFVFPQKQAARALSSGLSGAASFVFASPFKMMRRDASPSSAVAEVEGLVALPTAVSRTLTAASAFAAELVATALSKSTVMVSYDSFFAFCQPYLAAVNGMARGLPAVLVAAGGAGVVSAMVAMFGGRSAGQKRSSRELLSAVAKEAIGLASFFGLYHVLLLSVPALSATSLGVALGGAFSGLAASFIPTDYSALSKLWKKSEPKVEEKGFLAKLESFFKTAIFCGVSSRLDVLFGI